MLIYIIMRVYSFAICDTSMLQKCTLFPFESNLAARCLFWNQHGAESASFFVELIELYTFF